MHNQVRLILLVLVAQMAISDSNSKSVLGEEDAELTIPCHVESAVMYQGKCIQCIRPNYSLSSCLKDLKNCSNENVVMCTKEEDIEKKKINAGKAFLNGRLLRIVTIERPPFVKMSTGNFTGVIFELMYALQEKYNFTSDIFFPYDGKWGSKEKNSTYWNGMVGQVIRSQADVGAAGFSVTLERARVIDFTVPFHQEPTGILIPAPKSGSKLTILVRPLSSEVWLAVFTTICVLVPSLFVMHIVSLRIRGEPNKSPVNAIVVLVDIIQFIIGSLVQESITAPVKSSRFLIVIWWFLTLVISNIYVAYMVSFLSAPKLFDVVDNLEGLLHQTVIKWTYRKNTALEDLFQSDAGIYAAIGRGVRDSDLVTNDMAGVEKVLTGKFAFLKEKSFLDVAISTDFERAQKCRLTVAAESFFTVGFALILQKGSLLLRVIDLSIHNVVTSGLMEKWKSMHWPRNLWCANAASYIISTQPKTRKLTIDDCQGENLILLCGLTAATLAFLFEIREKLKLQFIQWWKCHKFLKKPSGTNRGHDQLFNGVKIIVVPIKEEYYRKINGSKSKSHRK